MIQGQSEAPAFDPEQPFALQLEWLANRYNPGHFLGGTICPELRVGSLGWHAKRVAGALALVSGSAALMTVVVIAIAGRLPPDPWSLGVGALSVAAGIKMWKVAKKPAPSRYVADPAEGRKLLRAVALAGLGAAVVAVGSMLALAAVGMAVAVSRGNPVIGVAMFAILAGLAAARQRRRPTRGRS
jgi:hypothetical protein